MNAWRRIKTGNVLADGIYAIAGLIKNREDEVEVLATAMVVTEQIMARIYTDEKILEFQRLQLEHIAALRARIAEELGRPSFPL